MAMIFGSSNSSSSSKNSIPKGKGGKDTTDSVVPVDPYKHKVIIIIIIKA